jgi:hypothetical protein
MKMSKIGSLLREKAMCRCAEEKQPDKVSSKITRKVFVVDNLRHELIKIQSNYNERKFRVFLCLLAKELTSHLLEREKERDTQQVR